MNKNWWICRQTELLSDISQLKTVRIGMKAFHEVGQFIKPTTRFIQIFGRYATKTTIVVEEARLAELLEGKPLSVDLEVDPGYVILSLSEECVVGLGLYVNGRIHSQISKKALRKEMILSG